MPSRVASPPLAVVAAILVDDVAVIPDALAAVGSQVYEPAEVHVVGGGSAGRTAATTAGVRWAASLESMFGSVGHDTTYLWLVHETSRPKPDALNNLVSEAVRADAGVAGSKLLRDDRPGALLSIGMSTDVYGVTYLGLDDDEVDQGQYDVVRDVAATPGASMLVRRDLAQGIGGPDPTMAPIAAAVDLCQRARLRGARVVVVPSSEVLYPAAAAATGGWREEAGRIRGMLKVYSLLTLAWALPFSLVIGLIEALVAPFLGRWTLFDWLRAWLWNLIRLPSTVTARLQARRGRVVGDAELFRFQLRGSVKLRLLMAEIATRVRSRLPDDMRFGLAELGREFQQPAFVTGVALFLFLLVATRVVWSEGLPAVGYLLPLPDSARSSLEAYAGGWNPAGFGSPEPLRPMIGVTGLLQLVFLDSAAFTSAALTIAGMVVGVWGASRLMRGWGIGPVPGLVAGVVLMAGPATRAVTGGGEWGAFLGLGLLPWVLRVALRSWPRSWWGRLGRVAAVGWLSGLMAAFSPALLPVPVAVLVAWTLLGDLRSWTAPLLALVGAGLGGLQLLPWIAFADLEAFLRAGEAAFWEPGIVLVVALAVAVVGVVVAAERELAAVGIWGGLVAAGGALLARSGDLDLGHEVEAAGLAVAALGTAAVVAAALELTTRFDPLGGLRRLAGALGFLGAALVAVSTVLVLAPGRAGFPATEVDDALEFTATAGDAADSRVLLVGPAAALPGDSRDLDGAPYRVVSAPLPSLWEAWHAAPRQGDDAFEATLRSLISGETFRAGEALAPFGIRWVVVMGESPLERVFEGQLDMLPLGGLKRPSFVSESPDAVRALSDTGIVWTWDGSGYRGAHRQGGRIFLAENANGRWVPSWEQVGWGNSVAADDGFAEFRRVERRSRLGLQALGLFVLLLVVGVWGRRYP